MTYRICDWNNLFENNRTRELKKLDWVPIPNKMDGLGYSELVDHPDGAAHFGAWVAIVEIASRQSVRGTLPQHPAGIPHALARISRLPAGLFEAALPRLEAIGWIESFQEDTGIPQEGAGKLQGGAGIPQEGAARVRAREGKGIEEKGSEANGKEGSGRGALVPFVPRLNFDGWWLLWSSVRGTNHRMQAEICYQQHVTPETEAVCFECTESYLQSLDNPAKGYNPENFLIEQSREDFRARWPRARASPTRKKGFVEDVAEVFRERIAKEGKPW